VHTSVHAGPSTTRSGAGVSRIVPTNSRSSPYSKTLAAKGACAAAIATATTAAAASAAATARRTKPRIAGGMDRSQPM
jgi:hypothetical protein